MNKTQQGHVTINIQGSVAHIEFFHPSHNSLPGKLLKELKEAIEGMEDHPEVLVVKLTSGGDRTFCAGASFDELVAIEDEVVGKDFFMGFARVINAIRTSSKIVVGVVQGKAVGGGVGLASACDYCLATKYASIKLSELAVGIGPFVIGPAVQRKMGVSAFSELALAATEWRTAEWAKERGLFTEVFKDGDQLKEYTDHFIANLTDKNPEALRLLKQVFWEGTENWDALLEERAEMSGRLVLSEFSKNEIGKFLKA